ncbi:tyrosine-type recombinase/integrase [Rhodovibrio sodomensis]|uniref:tyrosine-type recombinase/integrase n=1 Tax=Rhodovibrio sodomensis TaxID=1088 RepID=UPI0019087562
MYLERRRNRYLAFHDIPEDVRSAFGGRKRFSQSTETGEKNLARSRAAIFERQWRKEIDRARKKLCGQVDLDDEAAFFRRALKETPEHERPILLDHIAEIAEGRIERAAARAGVSDIHDPAYDDLPVNAEADRFFASATGKLVPWTDHLDEYMDRLEREVEKKTADMRRSIIERFGAKFAHVQDVNRKEVQRWLDGQVSKEGRSPATMQSHLTSLRAYWDWLVSIEVAPEEVMPFDRLTKPKANQKQTKADERREFTPKQLVAILRAAEERQARTGKDQPLVDLIVLGMWTGCRREELGKLKVAHVHGDHFVVEDAKTSAGWRAIPIHSQLRPTIDRLTADSIDGYVLPSTAKSQYGDRSPPLGQKFGRLKTRMGYDDRYVFHSIRKTFATMLKQVGEDESVVADLMGHEYKTMTFGHYASEHGLDRKRAAIEKISYPL